MGVVLLLLAAGAVFLLFRNWRPVAERPSEVISIDAVQKLHSAEVLSKSHGALRLRLFLRRQPYIVLSLPKKIHGAKLHLEIGDLQKVREIRIYPKLAGKPYSYKNVILLPVGKAGGVRHHFNAILPDGDYENVRIDFKSGDHFGFVEIRGISLYPVETGDRSFWAYILAFFMAAFVLVPGILLFALVHKRVGQKGVWLSVFTVYSVLFYVLLYLIWLVVLKWWPAAANPAVLVSVFGGLPLLCWLNRYRDFGVGFYIGRLRRELCIYLALVMVSCFILVQGNNLPLENTWYTTISGQTQSKTYRAFRAHDAVFHYVNGIAISNDEPFERYYGNRALFYGVEDRGILPGMLYGTFRSLLKNFSTLLADSYLVYTLMGTCFNLMVLFPAFAFVRRYAGVNNVWLFSLAFSLNAFILVNYYLTWFKMAGAAFFLSGLYMMFRAVRQRSLSGWGLAGLLLGVGSNMHAGSALGIPLFFLWAAWRNMKAGIGWVRTLAGPALLVMIFAAANLPWALVKKLYLNDQYRLIKEHFLAGYSDPAGIGKSVLLFFSKVPFSEQLAQRMERLWSGFRLTEIGELWRVLQHRGLEHFCRLWNRYEFSYTAFVLYPFIFLGFLAVVTNLGLKKNGYRGKPTVNPPQPAPVVQMVLSAATLLVIIVLSYGSHAPDITYHQPMGVIVLLYLLLIGTVMSAGRNMRIVMSVYLGLAAFRLTVYFG